MIGIKEIKVCLVLTVFYWIKNPCCEELLDSQCSAHERPLSGPRISVSVITGEPSRYHQDSVRAFILRSLGHCLPGKNEMPPRWCRSCLPVFPTATVHGHCVRNLKVLQSRFFFFDKKRSELNRIDGVFLNRRTAAFRVAVQWSMWYDGDNFILSKTFIFRKVHVCKP